MGVHVRRLAIFNETNRSISMDEWVIILEGSATKEISNTFPRNQ